MIFGDHLFGGSRFIFWSLAPFLLGFAVFVIWMVDTWTPAVIVLVVVLDIPILFLVLGLYDPVRFRWALRVTTGMVFMLYSWYLVDMWVLSDKEFKFFVSRSEASPMTSLLGFIIIGIPSLIFTLKGRFRWKSSNRGLSQL